MTFYRTTIDLTVKVSMIESSFGYHKLDLLSFGTGVFHLMYPPSECTMGILTGNRFQLMYHGTLIGAKVLFCLNVY